MKHIILLLSLFIIGCAPVRTRLVVCHRTADIECVQSFLPKGSKVISVKPTNDRYFYEVEYK